ncbi:serine protease [Neobacillus cucumis]|uniref:trypsin-like serine peptidase n=1 Tax=Neobacillus cucumis TaxID=1740721 RepID=UPI0020419523|nr:serine protease [Neobacillus cucumis]MCM3724589.1 serine protease [Neobacillus cucumis]
MSIYTILQDPKFKQDVLDQLGRKEFQVRYGYGPKDIDQLLKNLSESNEIASGITSPANGMESIVRSVGRPVIKIIHNTFMPPISSEWSKKLTDNRKNIEDAILAVGRIEVRDLPGMDWLGTGWMVKENIVITNRHVALEFAKGSGSEFVFRKNYRNVQIQARIDFREEYGLPDQLEFNIEKVLYIEEDDDTKPDIAFLQVSSNSNPNSTLPRPINLSEESLLTTRDVVVIGYPSRDSRVGDLDEMDRLFESIYDVKRLSPGQAFPSDKDWIINHDCTTLGGNSGSVILDIETGKALGIHSGGHYMDKNYGVSSKKIIEILNSIS